MLSKRGKANGKAKANKTPRTARANRKSKAKPGRPRKSRSAGVGNANTIRQLVAAPLNVGVSMSHFFGWKWGEAPKHVEYPSGGLRISGCLPSANGLFTEAKDTTYGLFASGTLASAMINPCGSYVSTTSAALFDPASPLAVFAQYFRKFHFAALDVDFKSEVPPGVVLQSGGAGLQIQVSYESDPLTAASLGATYTIDSAVTSGLCDRTDAWVSKRFPVIRQGANSPSRELFFITLAGEIESAAGDASIRQSCQGAVTAVGSTFNGTSALNIGKILLYFTVDLYGFSNVVAGDINRAKRDFRQSCLRRAIAAEQGPRSEPNVDRKSKAPSEDEPDACEIVDLTPKSTRLMINPTLVSKLPVDDKKSGARSISLK